MTVTQAINTRKSIRQYKDSEKSIPQEQIDVLLEAAMKAPSACNTRPWMFVVVQGRAKLNALSEATAFAHMLKQASLAIVVCALPAAQASTGQGFFPQDCGAATQNILLQAVELGLGSCWCGVYPHEKTINDVRKVLGNSLDSGAVPFNIIAVGYPDEDPGSRGFFEKSKVIYVS